LVEILANNDGGENFELGIKVLSSAPPPLHARSKKLGNFYPKNFAPGREDTLNCTTII
jgi:hypothetical protein